MLTHIILGDFSSDGHEKTEKVLVNIDAEFTPEQLYGFYHASALVVGFGVSDFANEYEDAGITFEQVEKLAAAGFTGVFEGLEDSKAEGRSVVDVSRAKMVEIVMFYYLRGLDVKWDVVTVDSVPLNGFYGMSPVGPQDIGYGLFS